MNRWLRYGILAAVLLLHGVVLLTVSITTRMQEQREDTTLLKMVDVREYRPPVPEPPEEEPEPPPPEAEMIVTDQPAEIVVETEEEIVPVPPPQSREPEFLPQHRISRPPEIPTEEIRSRVKYPVLANRQGIEGVVYLELFIDEAGVIQRIEILREPGFGLGDAAAAAFDGIDVTPAESNGAPVAVRFRYPVRFQLR
ncbi:MAG: TonB family protein [Alkalispirochaeta sp.]